MVGSYTQQDKDVGPSKLANISQTDYLTQQFRVYVIEWYTQRGVKFFLLFYLALRHVKFITTFYKMYASIVHVVQSNLYDSDYVRKHVNIEMLQAYQGFNIQIVHMYVVWYTPRSPPREASCSISIVS